MSCKKNDNLSYDTTSSDEHNESIITPFFLREMGKMAKVESEIVKLEIRDNPQAKEILHQTKLFTRQVDKLTQITCAFC